MELQDIEDLPQGLDIDSRERKEEYKLKQKLRKKKGQERASHQKKKTIDDGEGSDGEVEFDQFQQNNNVPGTQKIYIKTYGCSHNISDSEFMMGLLVEYGYQLVDSMEQCDLVLINSCTVKNPSEQSFLILVNQAKQIKKPLVVAGCVPQGDRNIKDIEDISIVGVTQIDRVVEVVEETLKGNKVQLLAKKELPSLDLPKIRKNKQIEMQPNNSINLIEFQSMLDVWEHAPIAKPNMREENYFLLLVSYSPEALISRTQQVISEGVKEIWLTSEDTGAYGRDIGTNISVLLKSLIEVLPNGVMLRIGMTNPPYILEHLENIAMILNHPRVYSFLHIPVQSGSNSCLERMNREYTREEFETVCDYLLKNVPGISLCTDIICGFPGETEEEFDDTMSLIQKYKFPALNISQFYSRPGTAAAKMKKVNSKDVKARSSKLTKLFESFNRTEHLLGTIQKVYINEKEEKNNKLILVGHTKQYVKVILPFESNLIGKEVLVKVDNTMTWHIEGTIIDRNPQPSEIPADYWKDFKCIIKSNMESKVQKILKEQQEEENKELMEEDKVQTEENKNCKCTKNGGVCCNGDNCKCNKKKQVVEEVNELKQRFEQPQQPKKEVGNNGKSKETVDRTNIYIALAHVVVVLIAMYLRELFR